MGVLSRDEGVTNHRRASGVVSREIVMTTGAGVGASTGLQVAGGIYTALESQRIGRYNARAARANAEQDALVAFNEAAQQERLAAMLQDELAHVSAVEAFQQAQLATAIDRQIGAAEATIGASGVAFTGSPIAALEASERAGENQQLALRFQADLQRRALTEEITQLRYGAELARFGAGERLRLGRQQAGLARVEAFNRTAASVLGVAGDIGTGVQTYRYVEARQQNPTVTT